MYNKEALLLALLDKANVPELVKHIKSLKVNVLLLFSLFTCVPLFPLDCLQDIMELKLTPNPGYKPSDKADVYNDVQAAKYVCSISNLEMSGRYRFVASIPDKYSC